MPAPSSATYSAAAWVAAHTSFKNLIDAGSGAGSIKIRDSSDVLLAQVPLSDPCSTVNGTTGQLTFSIAGPDTSADASVRTYGEFCDSDGLVHLGLPAQAGRVRRERQAGDQHPVHRGRRACYRFGDHWVNNGRRCALQSRCCCIATNTNGTTFTDNGPTPKTGSAECRCADQHRMQNKFGGASGIFDGTNDYLSVGTESDWKFLHDDTTDFQLRAGFIGLEDHRTLTILSTAAATNTIGFCYR